MDNTNRKRQSNSKVINASEIGQFNYCSISWYLQKKGYKPESFHMDQGILEHKKLGETIDNTEKDLRKSKFFMIAGNILLIIAIIIFVFEVLI